MGQYRSSFANAYEERVVDATTARTLAMGDASKTIYIGGGGNATVTLPLHAAVPYEVGTEIHLVRNHATNTLTVAAGGTTIRNTGTALTVLRPWGKVTLTKVAADEWFLSGNVTGAFS